MQCVWVVDAQCKSSLWSRRFPTVLGRAGRGLIVPDDDEFLSAFGSSLQLYREAGESMVPVMDIRSTLGMHRVVFVESALGLLVGMPLCKSMEALVVVGGGVALLDVPELAAALETLSQLASFLESQQVQHSGLGYAFWASVNVAVSLSMPFGSLVRPFHVGESISSMATMGAAPSSFEQTGALDAGTAARAPAWRVAEPGVAIPKKSKIVLCIEEVIESHQYDRAGGGQDSARLRGRVTLFSDYAAPQMEVSMKVALALPTVGDRLSSDSCVTVFTSTATQKMRTVHLTAVPSLRHLHTLLRYEAPPPSVMPWRAFYQMKPGPGPKEAKVLIQLKLSENVPNQFEGCHVVIPFEDTGGNVESFEVSPTEGTVRRSSSDGASTLVWDLGNSIVGNSLAGRRLECALPMTVRFVNDSISANARWACFAELVFRMIGGSSLCGVSVLTDEVVVFPKPPYTPQVSVSTVISSGVYRIFNSLA